MVSLQILKLPNETAQFIEEETDWIRYIYDFYIELVLVSVNGRNKDNDLSVPKLEVGETINDVGISEDTPEAMEWRKVEFEKHI